jgi:flagellar biosynthesis anti-sigma factor FlgM
MTNSINPLSSYLQAASTETQPGSAAAATAGSASLSTATADSTAGSEAVTVSSDAATTTQLLDTARGADGIDQSAVARLRGAIQSGTYDVTPDSLAQAMLGAAKASS